MEKEFYVGYLPKAPKQLGFWLTKLILLLVVVGSIAALIFGTAQENLPPINFEYGTQTTLQGFITKDPFPVLHASSRSGQTEKSILLVNFGKYGAQIIVDQWEKKAGGNLTGMEATIQGTLIYYDGITLMELTNEERSLVATQPKESANTEPVIEDLGRIKLTGEILDSKCYFGVMNPGHGKTHRSCAIRCISGGIPPIFGSNVGKNTPLYTVVVGPDGNVINKELLPIVGKRVTLEGTLQQRGDLKYLLLDKQIQGLVSLQLPLDTNMAICRND